MSITRAEKEAIIKNLENEQKDREEEARADAESEQRAERAFGRLVERGVFVPWDDEEPAPYEPWDDVYSGTAQEYDGD